MSEEARSQQGAVQEVLLPNPRPDMMPPPEGDPRDYERLYFDPEKWNAEIANFFLPADEDRIKTGQGKLEGQGRGAIFLSDFHLADGTAGGDDFLESHLHPDEAFRGLHAGFFPPGPSRATLFASVLTFGLQRLSEVTGVNLPIDVVLAGDVVNFLELKGRGSTPVGRSHLLFFRTLAAIRDQANVFWLRGNHDYVVPTGPWRVGEFYANGLLRTLVEHGDFWDKQNWPPGPLNEGSKLAIELGGPYEVHASVMREGSIRYLFSGIDNIRPWNNKALQGFLDRRAKHSDVAAVSAMFARMDYLGAADDSAAYKGALERRRDARYRDWLMVQGHTHVPAMDPDVYYNLGTWISTLVAPKNEEKVIDAFPFLLVYLTADGQRREEYYIVFRDSPESAPRAVLQTEESVNALRETFGYSPLKS
jgi:hypothetical protein